MAVSGINGSTNIYISTSAPKTNKQSPGSNSPTPTHAATATVSSAGSSAVAPSSRAAVIASITNGSASAGSAPPPKVNPVKQEIKESNEPIQLLTKQAKHGDVIAKRLLKQINAKQAAKQAEAAKSHDAEGAESSASTEESSPAEAGKGELVDRHA